MGLGWPLLIVNDLEQRVIIFKKHQLGPTGQTQSISTAGWGDDPGLKHISYKPD